MSIAKIRDYDKAFKLLLIGNSGVGKSCLLLRFADDNFTESYITTIGVDFRFRTMLLDNTSVRLQVWDTAGQERFRTITSAYYRGADGIFLVYDTTDRDSFKCIDDWMREVNLCADDMAIKILLGNKSDLTAKRAVSVEEAQAKAAELGIGHIETSAKTAVNVESAFEQIARELLKSREETNPRSASGVVNVEDLRSGAGEGGYLSSCCNGSGSYQ
eukprot:GHVN01074159.1.p1 GENE.GHVN01074159.1~~GHVN01074159.1.p1  ORF type:complete len:216 (+),score=15.18 GHVN01074159.1:931-1578(+)